MWHRHGFQSAPKRGEARRASRETYREAARGVARDGPAPAAVEGGALLEEDADDAAAAERLRVHLALDLERVEREEDLRSTPARQPTLCARGAGGRYARLRRCPLDCVRREHPGRARQEGRGGAHLPAVACIIILPLRSPNAFVKLSL